MKLLPTLLLFMFLTGCASGSSFMPSTIEGAQCKNKCAHKQQSCCAFSVLATISCDKSYVSCIESCIDIDRVSGNGNQ